MNMTKLQLFLIHFFFLSNISHIIIHSPSDIYSPRCLFDNYATQTQKQSCWNPSSHLFETQDYTTNFFLSPFSSTPFFFSLSLSLFKNTLKEWRFFLSHFSFFLLFSLTNWRRCRTWLLQTKITVGLRSKRRFVISPYSPPIHCDESVH